MTKYDEDVALQVMQDIRTRRKLGLQRYGQTVSADSAYDMLTEAYEEALDLCIYLRAAIIQRERQVRGHTE